MGSASIMPTRSSPSTAGCGGASPSPPRRAPPSTTPLPPATRRRNGRSPRRLRSSWSPSAQLVAAIERGPHRAGVALVRAILGQPGGPRRTRSDGERAMLRLIRAAGLPTPLTNHPVAGFDADFFWPEVGLIVEVDGGDFHRTAPGVRTRPSPRHRPHGCRPRGAPGERTAARSGAALHRRRHRPGVRPPQPGPRIASEEPHASPAHERRRDRGRRPAGAAARPARGRRDRAGRDRPGRQPLGDGPVDHHPAAAVGAGGGFRRRHGRVRHRRDAGGLRAAGQPRAGRGVRGRAGRVRHQPRLEPGRRHHLLGDGGGGARGDRARPARDRGVAAVERARARLQGGHGVRLRGRGDVHRPPGGGARDRAAARRHAAQRQRPRPAPERRRGGEAGQARLPGRALARRRDRRHGGCTGSTGTRATSATRPGPTWPRWRRARSR